MKINIITVFKSQNCGSFLQAVALKEILSSMGNDVRFLDYNPVIYVMKRKILNIIQCCLRFRFKRAFDIIKQEMDFKKHQKMFATSRFDESADVYFFGSDTLWNFNDNFFVENEAFFTGAGLKKPCYTYAMSVGSASKEAFFKRTEAIKNIQKFKRIAVRDEHTKDVLSEFYYNNELVKTVDPTMLLGKEYYINHFSRISLSQKKYLLIYHFGAIDEKTWQDLQRFTKSKNLTILNIGLSGELPVTCVGFSPTNFISAFLNAEYIFTNTFHGCVFSTIFNKQFATDGIYKKKVEGFLEEFSLLDRVVGEEDNVEKILTTPVDYDLVNDLVEKARKSSIDYLKNVLDEVKSGE